MPKLVGLVRGINVGGANLVKMADLRAFIEGLGATEVETLLQSGNFVFEGGKKSATAWQRLMADESPKRLGLKVEYYVRTEAEWCALVKDNPFRKKAKADPAHTIAIVFNALPSSSAVKEVENVYKGPESFALGSRALYAVFPLGMGQSKLSSHTGWKKLTATGTARNWNTVLKLTAMLER